MRPCCGHDPARADAGSGFRGARTNPYLWGALALTGGREALALGGHALRDLLDLTLLDARSWLTAIGLAAVPLAEPNRGTRQSLAERCDGPDYGKDYGRRAAHSVRSSASAAVIDRAPCASPPPTNDVLSAWPAVRGSRVRPSTGSHTACFAGWSSCRRGPSAPSHANTTPGGRSLATTDPRPSAAEPSAASPWSSRTPSPTSSDRRPTRVIDSPSCCVDPLNPPSITTPSGAMMSREVTGGVSRPTRPIIGIGGGLEASPATPAQSTIPGRHLVWGLRKRTPSGRPWFALARAAGPVPVMRRRADRRGVTIERLDEVCGIGSLRQRRRDRPSVGADSGRRGRDRRSALAPFRGQQSEPERGPYRRRE